MKKIEITNIADALSELSISELEPQKGLKVYRFYKQLREVQNEVREYHQKLRQDFGIKDKDNNVSDVHKFNEAFALLANEEADIKIEPFLTEEEAIEIFGKYLNMHGLDLILPIVVMK